MKQFLDENFLLQTKISEILYHEHAAKMPIIDYHCHLNPKDIAQDKKFDNLTQIWLYGDHYKWRAMRTNGVEEKYCTGDASDYEKFMKWAETVPYTLRNPLYHWTHLELKTAFGINIILNPKTAREVYDEASARLKTDEYSTRNIMRKFNVKLVCTTDDPVDILKHHKRIRKDDSEIKSIFNKIRGGNSLNQLEVLKFKSALLYDLAIMDFEKGWTQQFHIGALRNNNTRLFNLLGPDTGFDSIGDFKIAIPLAKFLDSLDKKDKLPKTIIYNLNPGDNELIATMIGNFQDGSIPGKIQFGSGWWFLDQKDEMERQMNALSNLGLLSRFVGMLTDSRSLLSYPRHENFRRILCNLIGNDVEDGLIPDDMDLLGQMVEDICYNNAKNYFKFDIQ